MFSLHTGIFARMFTVLAVIGLVMGGVSVEAMQQVNNAGHEAMVMQVAGDMGVNAQYAKDASHQDNHCAMADSVASSDCDTSGMADQCDMGGNCCPHCVTALPLQLDANFGSLPNVQTSTPQWRVTSVTPVTEIRPPISIS